MPRAFASLALFMPAGGAALAGLTAASGRLLTALLVATAPAAVLVVVHAFARVGRLPFESKLAILAWVSLLFATFVWRVRTTTDLNENPLDTAGLARVALVLLAGSASFAWVVRPGRLPRIPWPGRWFAAYVVAAMLAGIVSPQPQQALYRATELAVCFLAVLLALSHASSSPPAAIVGTLRTSLAALVTVVWVEAFLVPWRAWVDTPGVFPRTLHGVFPTLSSNTVGTLGGLLAILALSETAYRKHHFPRALVLLGLMTLAAAQYRTGILGFLVAGTFLLWRQRRFAVMAALAITTVAIGLGGAWTTSVDRSKTAFAKGRPEQLETLDSRTLYWQESAAFIRERPLMGWGLNVGSRRVLAGVATETTSTVHGTWVEALLGTGFVGASLLALSVLSALRQAWRARLHVAGPAAFAGLVFLVVRSLTGTTVELFGLNLLVFLGFIVLLDRLTNDSDPRARERLAT